MSGGFTKLHSSLLGSSVWTTTDLATKAVWITLLAAADATGKVVLTVPGIAQACGISIEKTEEALKLFMSPDKYSRTKDFEGRRIEECDDGWRLLNHAKYRALRHADERREYDRIKKAETRRKKRSGPDPNIGVWKGDS